MLLGTDLTVDCVCASQVFLVSDLFQEEKGAADQLVVLSTAKTYSPSNCV